METKLKSLPCPLCGSETFGNVIVVCRNPHCAYCCGNYSKKIDENIILHNNLCTLVNKGRTS